MNANDNLDIMYKINFYINSDDNKVQHPIDINQNNIIINIDHKIIQYDPSRNPIIYKNITDFSSLKYIDKLI